MVYVLVISFDSPDGLVKLFNQNNISLQPMHTYLESYYRTTKSFTLKEASHIRDSLIKQGVNPSSIRIEYPPR